jgi:hypothetical protein
MPLVSSTPEPGHIHSNRLPLVPPAPKPDGGFKPQIRTNEGKQQESTTKGRGLSAADGHQWAKSDQDINRREGKRKPQRPRRMGQAKQ